MSSTDCNQLQLESAIQGNLKLSIQFHEKNVLICFVVFFSYLSHATEEPYSNGGRDSRGPVYNMDHAALSEQTINAMLRPLGFRGKSITQCTILHSVFMDTNKFIIVNTHFIKSKLKCMESFKLSI